MRILSRSRSTKSIVQHWRNLPEGAEYLRQRLSFSSEPSPQSSMTSHWRFHFIQFPLSHSKSAKPHLTEKYFKFKKKMKLFINCDYWKPFLRNNFDLSLSYLYKQMNILYTLIFSIKLYMLETHSFTILYSVKRHFKILFQLFIFKGSLSKSDLIVEKLRESLYFHNLYPIK